MVFKFHLVWLMGVMLTLVNVESIIGVIRFAKLILKLLKSWLLVKNKGFANSAAGMMNTNPNFMSDSFISWLNFLPIIVSVLKTCFELHIVLLDYVFGCIWTLG